MGNLFGIASVIIIGILAFAVRRSSLISQSSHRSVLVRLISQSIAATVPGDLTTCRISPPFTPLLLVQYHRPEKHQLGFLKINSIISPALLGALGSFSLCIIKGFL